MSKTSIKIVREVNGECTITVTFSKKDFERHNSREVLLELLKDASSDEFYNFLPDSVKQEGKG